MIAIILHNVPEGIATFLASNKNISLPRTSIPKNILFAKILARSKAASFFTILSILSHSEGNGNIIDIFDRETQIIDTTVIDDCASLLNQQFDDLYNEEVENA